MKNILLEYYLFLDKALHYFNEVLFGNGIGNCVLLISIQKNNNILGHFRQNSWMHIKKDAEIEKSVSEIVIYSGYLLGNRTQFEVLMTLIHEVIHYLNAQSNLTDTVGGRGSNHNIYFKQTAERYGFVFGEKHPSKGWINYTPSERLSQIIETFIQDNPLPFSKLTAKIRKPAKKEKVIFNYVCEECNVKIKAKENAQLICGICGGVFERDKKEMERDALKALNEQLMLEKEMSESNNS